MPLYTGDHVEFIIGDSVIMGTIMYFQLDTDDVRCAFINVGNEQSMLIESAVLTPTRKRSAVDSA